MRTAYDNPWAKHYQRPWHDMAGDRTLPSWLRVAALAYGSHRANLHANFRPGAIGVVLGEPGPNGRPMDRANVQRAIKLAVERGWLAEGSGSLCLVVPSHRIEGGLGSPHERCKHHSKGVKK